MSGLFILLEFYIFWVWVGGWSEASLSNPNKELLVSWRLSDHLCLKYTLLTTTTTYLDFTLQHWQRLDSTHQKLEKHFKRKYTDYILKGNTEKYDSIVFVA